MNIQRLLLTIAIATNFGNTSILAEQSQNNNNEQQDHIQERNDTQDQFNEIYRDHLRRRLEGFPSDPNKTPTDPDIIEHYRDLVFGQNFYRKRIFFGTDESGKPCYKRIMEHEQNNPKFGDVDLVIFHKAAWHKLRFSDSFEVAGIYVDEDARHKTIQSMAGSWLFGKGEGGVWDPQRNTIFGGTRDKEIGKKFDEYMERQKANQSKFNKFK